ncbi:MAG: peptidylprolyl isomerase, partial [Flavobacteriaceae bacterium]|nr:peptidylprolyl isomerase [Flavobacteriaceae bacterium]
MNLKFMKKRKNKFLLFTFATFTLMGMAQEESGSETTADPGQQLSESTTSVKDTVNSFKKIKLDGIAAVVGDYVILDSDIEKTLIDLRSQGASTEDITHCSLLGKLMEDRLYAHQAVQDSILVSDDEVNATSDRQIQQLVQQVGSMDKVLQFYKKETVEDFREELYNINKLRMLSEKMQQKIVGEIQVTPEEVRQFFKNIPEDEKPVFGAELE